MRGVTSARAWLLMGFLGVLHLLVLACSSHRHNLDALYAELLTGPTWPLAMRTAFAAPEPG